MTSFVIFFIALFCMLFIGASFTNAVYGCVALQCLLIPLRKLL